MMDLNYLISLKIKFNKTWYNIYEAYYIQFMLLRTGLNNIRRIFNITLNLCIMQDITNALPNNDGKYILYSINAVRKKLKLGYTKTKKLIEYGIIESVTVFGKLMVPQCKLEKFINQKQITLNNLDSNFKSYSTDEDEALKIISNLKN